MISLVTMTFVTVQLRCARVRDIHSLFAENWHLLRVGLYSD